MKQILAAILAGLVSLSGGVMIAPITDFEKALIIWLGGAVIAGLTRYLSIPEPKP